MKSELDKLKSDYTEEMQAAARIAAALPMKPWVDNETRPEEPVKEKLVEKRPTRDY